MRKAHSRPDPAVAGEDDPRGSDAPPSKSQRKRDAHALQALGEKLVATAPDKVAALGLDETLLDAIALARKIRSNSAQRRQAQLIGKLMREADAEAIAAALDTDGRGHRAEVAQMHAAERWRERLIASPDALGEWRERHGGSQESEQVEALIAPARAEHARGQPGRRYRDLYRALRAALADKPPATEQDSSDA